MISKDCWSSFSFDKVSSETETHYPFRRSVEYSMDTWQEYLKKLLFNVWWCVFMFSVKFIKVLYKVPGVTNMSTTKRWNGSKNKRGNNKWLSLFPVDRRISNWWCDRHFTGRGQRVREESNRVNPICKRCPQGSRREECGDRDWTSMQEKFFLQSNNV